jgi:feruloyl esterase
LTHSNPQAAASASLDISKLVKHDHKIIWYHGLSDPCRPVLGTLVYYNQMSQQFGGLRAAQNFSRLYPLPNTDHCSGGATTDHFDMLTPLVNWGRTRYRAGPRYGDGREF